MLCLTLPNDIDLMCLNNQCQLAGQKGEVVCVVVCVEEGGREEEGELFAQVRFEGGLGGVEGGFEFGEFD